MLRVLTSWAKQDRLTHNCKFRIFREKKMAFIFTKHLFIMLIIVLNRFKKGQRSTKLTPFFFCSSCVNWYLFIHNKSKPTTAFCKCIFSFNDFMMGKWGLFVKKYKYSLTNFSLSKNCSRKYVNKSFVCLHYKFVI